MFASFCLGPQAQIEPVTSGSAHTMTLTSNPSNELGAGRSACFSTVSCRKGKKTVQIVDVLVMSYQVG